MMRSSILKKSGFGTDASAQVGDKEANRQELVFGLVAAIGADSNGCVKDLRAVLAVYDYDLEEIVVSRLIQEYPRFAVPEGRRSPRYYHDMIAGGDSICAEVKDEAALADGAIAEIKRRRAQRSGNSRAKVAYVIRQLKRPTELERLRGVYSGMFYAIGVFANEARRRNRLARQLSEIRDESDLAALSHATTLMSVDENERDRWGQKVSDTFANVDYIVGSDAEPELRQSLERFVSLVFAKPHVSPRIGEVAMMHAHVAGLRSVDLSRQIGAAVVARDGRLLVTGCNEVPRGGGGQYWESDTDDHRDFLVGHDINDLKKQEVVIELLSRIRESLRPEFATMTAPALADALKEGKILDGSMVDSLLEFGRVSHAEMSALMSATEAGVALRDCDLYTTTFPCHLCTRLIIAAGIRNVFYIEPYPKSAALRLYGDREIVVNPKLLASQMLERACSPTTFDKRTYFMPFNGASPRRYQELFAKSRSKDKNEGSVLDFVPIAAKPRRTPEFTVSYEASETLLATRWAARSEALHQKAPFNEPAQHPQENL